MYHVNLSLRILFLVCFLTAVLIGGLIAGTASLIYHMKKAIKG